MIYVNERQENANLWQLAQHCQRQYRHYISDASETVIKQRFSTECDMALEGASRPGSDRLAFIWWGLSLAYDFKKTRNSLLYAADFSSNKSGYQHFADALAGCQEASQTIDAMLPDIVSGELKDTESLARTGQNETERAKNPVLYEELLQEVVMSGEEGRASPMPAEKTALVRQAYARLLYMDYVKKYIDAGYQVCRVFDKNQEYREKLDAAFASTRSDDANGDLVNALSEELRMLYGAFRSGDIQTSGIGEKRKMQRFDIFDHQISYLERVARAIEGEPRHNEAGVLIPSDMRQLKPESILLTNLVYREIKSHTGNHYSNDFWIIPGLYQSTLGIYGNHDTAPDLFFKTVLKDREAVGPAKHPVEDIIVVSGHCMVKLSKKAWDSFAAAEKQRDTGASLQVEMGDECPLPEDGGDSCPPAGMDILWKQYESESQRKTPLHAIAKDVDDTAPFCIEDNGGTGAYKTICALQQVQRTRQGKKETGSQEMLIRDAFWKDVAHLPDLSKTSQAMIPFLKKMATQDNILALNRQPLSLLSSNKAWDKISFKLILGYFCWLQPETAGRRSLVFRAADLNDTSEIVQDGIQRFQQALPLFRDDVQETVYTLSASAIAEDQVKIVLERRSIHNSSIRAWLFADGEAPQWTEESKNTFRDDVRDALLRFVASKCGINAGKREAFNRKSIARVSEYDVLLRLLICYALVHNHADHIILCPLREGDALMVPICAQGRVNEAHAGVGSLLELCEDIVADTDPFEAFLVSLAPRAVMNISKIQPLSLWLRADRYDASAIEKQASAGYLKLRRELEGYEDTENNPLSSDGQVLYKCWITNN